MDQNDPNEKDLKKPILQDNSSTAPTETQQEQLKIPTNKPIRIKTLQVPRTQQVEKEADMLIQTDYLKIQKEADKLYQQEDEVEVMIGSRTQPLQHPQHDSNEQQKMDQNDPNDKDPKKAILQDNSSTAPTETQQEQLKLPSLKPRTIVSLRGNTTQYGEERVAACLNQTEFLKKQKEEEPNNLNQQEDKVEVKMGSLQRQSRIQTLQRPDQDSNEQLQQTSSYFDSKNFNYMSIFDQQIQEYLRNEYLLGNLIDPKDVPLSKEDWDLDLLFFVLKESFKRINKEFYKAKNFHPMNYQSFQGLFTAGASDTQAYCVTLTETTTRYEDLENDKDVRLQFQANFTQALAQDLEIDKQTIKILEIRKGSIKVIYVVDGPAGKFESTNFTALQKQFPGSCPSLQIHQYFQAAALSEEDFSPDYNMTWDYDEPGDSVCRGPKSCPEQYYLPVGWKGYALNVMDRFEENKTDWLASNGNENEWVVMFHGTQMDYVNKIRHENLKPGRRQLYQSSVCKRTGQEIGQGVYFSNKIEVCEQYAYPTQVGNKNYTIVFQSRVNPKFLKECPLDEEGYDAGEQYFVINDSVNIRPYRILLKSESLVDVSVER